jgi:hypothetical protein
MFARTACPTPSLAQFQAPVAQWRAFCAIRRRICWSPGSVQGEFVWESRWIKWHWRFFRISSVLSLLIVIIPLLHIDVPQTPEEYDSPEQPARCPFAAVIICDPTRLVPEKRRFWYLELLSN